MKTRRFGNIFAIYCCYGILPVTASTVHVDSLSESIYWDCPNCSLTAAESLAASKGVGTHITYDLPGNIIYRMSCEQGGTSIICFSNRLTSGDHYNAFQAYRGLWISHGDSEHIASQVGVSITSHMPNNPNGGRPDDGYINAFDTIASSAALNSVISYVTNELAFQITIMEPVIIGSGGGDASIKMTYSGTDATCTVKFHDGSVRVLNYDKDIKTWVVRPNSAVDAHLNTLPEIPPHNYQVYNFSQPIAPYDSFNMYLLVAPAQLPPESGGNCTSETFDGTLIHCTHPF